MSGKLSKRTEQISIDLATKNYELKSNIIRNEFNGFVKGIENVDAILPQFQSKEAFIKQQRIVEELLLNHRAINKGWYAIVTQKDTIYQSIQKNRDIYHRVPILKHQKEWVQKALIANDTITRAGKLVSVADTLHWLVSSKHILSDGEVLILGLDINLKELQHYLWGVDSTGRASASVIDEHGNYVINPVEKFIGTKMPVPVMLSPITRRLKDSISTYEIVLSPILEIPVFRYYTPLNISSMKWTMILDTAALNVDEDVKDIEKYLMTMFISAALIILFFIAWAQAKWQREFMLRQRTEMKQQELSIEKQALSLLAERQQKENALLQLSSLKQKVNPHFLFNSLSSLNALIEKSPELAKSFVLKLSRVYRYVLESYPNGLATVNEEIRFANEYFFLQKIRFGEALESMEIRISDQHLEQRIPFMSLQTLIENAIKHNVISKERPLKISIESIGEYIVVTNNLQLRNDIRDSGKQGLNYLQSTYAYFGSEHFKYGEDGDHYKCYLPLLKSAE
jgi:two-component system LytT family sensor kinase